MAENQKPLFEYGILRVVRNARGQQDYDLEIEAEGDYVPFYLGRNSLETLSKVNDIGELTLRLDQIAPELLSLIKRKNRTVHDVRHAIHRARQVELEELQTFYFEKWQKEKDRGDSLNKRIEELNQLNLDHLKNATTSARVKY